VEWSSGASGGCCSQRGWWKPTDCLRPAPRWQLGWFYPDRLRQFGAALPSVVRWRDSPRWAQQIMVKTNPCVLISDCLWLRCAISGNEMDNLGAFSWLTPTETCETMQTHVMCVKLDNHFPIHLQCFETINDSPPWLGSRSRLQDCDSARQKRAWPSPKGQGHGGQSSRPRLMVLVVTLLPTVPINVVSSKTMCHRCVTGSSIASCQ